MPQTTAASSASAYVETAALGFTVGLPFALLALAARRQPASGSGAAGADAAWGVLRSRGALVGLALAAGGELIVDKLPFALDRIAPPLLGERLIAGALAGAAFCRLSGRSTVGGGVLGALAAAGGAEAGYHARRALGRGTGVPDPIWAVAEDLLTASLGVLALRRYLLR
jgi:uncharacterized membrane protein